ncbi:MAG: DUF4397 domain-containing protein [Myxococcota bacterium]
MPRSLLLTAIALALLSGCSRVDDLACGFGTASVGDECVSVSSCGPGTVLIDGQCTASDSGACGPGTRLDEDGATCVLEPGVCPAPSQLDSGTNTCTAPSSIACGSGTELIGIVCVPACTGAFELPNTPRTGCDAAARIQFVHASPDPVLANVDLYVDGSLAADGVGDNIDFGTATPMLKVPGGARLRVTVGSSTSDSTFLAEAEPSSIESFNSYAVVLRGVSASGFDMSVNDTMLTLDVIDSVQERAADGPEIAALHLVVDSSVLDIQRRGPAFTYETQPNLNTTSFGTLSSYEALPANDPIVFDLIGNGEVVASFLGPALSDGDSPILALTGFLDPTMNRGPSGQQSVPIQAVLLDPVAGSMPLDRAPRGQIVHAASVSEITSTVQSSGGLIAPLTAGLSYGDASPRFGLLAIDQQFTVSEMSSAVASIPLSPLAGESVRFVLIGDVGRADSRGLRLLIVDDASDGLDRDDSTIELSFVQAAVDSASRYDVHVSPASGISLLAPEFADLGYGEVGTLTRSVSRVDSIVSLSLPGITSLATAEFPLDLSLIGSDSPGALLVLTGDGSTPSRLELLVFARARAATRVSGRAP